MGGKVKMSTIENLTVNEEILRNLYLRKLALGEIQGPPTGKQSQDKPWLKYYSDEAITSDVPSMSMYQLLLENNKENLSSIAMRYFNVPITYKEYLKKIEKYAKALLQMGVKKGDIVALILPNVPECRELIYAINMIGAVSYPISPMIALEELNRIIQRNSIQNVFIFEQFYKKYHDALQTGTIKNIVINDGTESLPQPIAKFNKLRQKFSRDNVSSEITTDYRNIPFSLFAKQSKNYIGKVDSIYEPNSVAAIIGTSGTTGTSKGVCLTNENLNAMALQHLHGDMNFEKGDKILDILIQSIGYGIAVAHYSGVCSLESIMIPELVIHILPYINKHNISHFTGGPIHYETLLKDVKDKKIKLPKLKNCVSGGASLSKEVEKSLNNPRNCDVNLISDDDVFVRQGLGCTENGGAATYAKKGTYKFSGVGIPLAYETMAIFKPGTDEELGVDELGEICISGPTVMSKYLNNEEETAQVLKKHSDGKIWLHTYDLGRMDKDGQVYITDRIKNIFMRRGFNVHPSTINEYLESLPMVDSSAVVGIEHPDEQMVPVAFVKLANSDFDLSETKKELLNKCFLNLEETSVPYDVIFVDDLPRNLGGKVDEKKLVETYGINYMQEKPKIKQKI